MIHASHPSRKLVTKSAPNPARPAQSSHIISRTIHVIVGRGAITLVDRRTSSLKMEIVVRRVPAIILGKKHRVVADIAILTHRNVSVVIAAGISGKEGVEADRILQ